MKKLIKYLLFVVLFLILCSIIPEFGAISGAIIVAVAIFWFIFKFVLPVLKRSALKRNANKINNGCYIGSKYWLTVFLSLLVSVLCVIASDGIPSILLLVFAIDNVLLFVINRERKNIIPIKQIKTYGTICVIISILYLLLYLYFFVSGNLDSDILCIPLALMIPAIAYFVHLLNIYRGIQPVKQNIEANKSINLSDEYDLKGGKINKFLVTYSNNIPEIQANIEQLTPDKNQTYQQLVLSIIYPTIKNYDALVVRKFDTLYYMNTSKMLESANKNLSEEERKLILQRLSNDYSSIPLDNIELMLSAASGLICGFIDAFFVGKPGDSKLGELTDKATDKLVIKAAGFLGWNPKEGDENNIASAIGFLERKYSVPYDARYAKDLGDESINMAPGNHHLKSLGHSPDLIGLIFSLIDQFMTTEDAKHTTLLVDGHIRMFSYGENEFELRGDNLVSKLFSGFANWIGHILSDVAGSSGGRGHSNNGRGSGVAAPFYECFQFLDHVKLGKEKKSISDISIKLFQNGYDARFMAAASIPVVLNEYIMRLSYLLKMHFYDKVEWEEINKLEILAPTKAITLTVNEDQKLNKMLVTGYGTFCATDISDALIRGKGATFEALLHINLPGLKNLAIEGFRTCLSVFRKLTASPEKIEQELLKEVEKISTDEEPEYELIED